MYVASSFEVTAQRKSSKYLIFFKKKAQQLRHSHVRKVCPISGFVPKRDKIGLNKELV